MAFKFDDAVIVFLFFLSLLPFVLLGFIIYGIYIVVKDIVLPVYDEFDSIFNTVKDFVKGGINEIVDFFNQLESFYTTIEKFIEDNFKTILNVLS